MKLDLDKFSDIPVERHISVPSQTIDSIFVYDTGRNITTTGKHIYEITTKAEKRMADSLHEIAKKEYPSPFAPSASFDPYSFEENTLFAITVYDSLGFEYTKLLEKELMPGEYRVNYSIYSVLEPGNYFLETRFKEQRQLRKLIMQ